VGLTFVDYDHDGTWICTSPMDPGVPLTISSGETMGTVRSRIFRRTLRLVFQRRGAGVVTTDFNNDRPSISFWPGSSGSFDLSESTRREITALSGIDFRKENLPAAWVWLRFDFDKDGWMDLAFTHAGAPGISLWRNLEGKRLERVALPDFGWQRAWESRPWTTTTMDGSICRRGETSSGAEIRLLRNLGARAGERSRRMCTWCREVESAAGDRVADLRGSGGADLVVTQLGGEPVVLRNDGGNKHIGCASTSWAQRQQEWDWHES